MQSSVPIFAQVAEQLENAVLTGALGEDMQAPSTTEISVNYKINPATALKGMTMLVEDGILYKKRGLGMFVAKGAKDVIQKKRKQQFFEKFVQPLLSEAQKLSISPEEISQMICAANACAGETSGKGARYELD
jgi:DNA-binding transcriptional regulator YhcF (GntR family)